MSNFKREVRYTVIKHNQLTDAQIGFLKNCIHGEGIPTVKAVVVESDWPEYEPVWKMIEDRVTGVPIEGGKAEYDAMAKAMTNDKTVTMSRELAERISARLERLNAGFCELRALLAAPVVERQPEPVAAQVRFRPTRKELIGYREGKDFGPWQYTDLDRVDMNQLCYIDSVGYETEKRVLFASPPAPVAVLHFVCDRIPDQNGCTFIECENSEGSSINAGEWVVRPDGLAQLVVSRPPLKLPEYKRPPPGCVITQEMAAHNACLDKVKELNQ